MRVVVFVITLVCGALALSGVPVLCDTQAASRETYRAFDVSVEIPAPHRSFDAGKTPGSMMDVGYEHAGLAYDVIIAPLAPQFRSDAAIDDYLNKMLGLTNRIQQVIASRHPSDKWNVSAKNNLQFTGLTVDDFIMDAHFDRIAPDHKVSTSMAIAVLKSDYSQVMIVSVVGPRDRRSEIEAATKSLSQSVDKAGTGSAVGTKLQPGQIELVGVVESVASDSKSLVLNVDTVTTCNQASATLDPPRPKTVLIDSLPKEIIVGSRVRVIGQNGGPGKPIRAKVLSPAGS